MQKYSDLGTLQLRIREFLFIRHLFFQGGLCQVEKPEAWDRAKPLIQRPRRLQDNATSSKNSFPCSKSLRSQTLRSLTKNKPHWTKKSLVRPHFIRDGEKETLHKNRWFLPQVFMTSLLLTVSTFHKKRTSNIFFEFFRRNG